MKSVRMLVAFLLLSFPFVAFAGFLSFPLACGDPYCNFIYNHGAYTALSMNSVLDHSMQINSNGFYQYGTYPSGADGIIKAFNGEQVSGARKSADPTCIGGTIYLHPDWNPSTRMTNDSGCGAGYSSYDEHPGYDYKAAYNSYVFAAANGTVVNNGGQRCVLTNISSCNNFGYVGIDHGNGYITQYGHLSSITVSPGQYVYQGQFLGYSSDTGVPGNPHLHFEVIKLIPGRSANYGIPANYAVVDPYGWVGGGQDPLYSRLVYGISPANLWQ